MKVNKKYQSAMNHQMPSHSMSAGGVVYSKEAPLEIKKEQSTLFKSNLSLTQLSQDRNDILPLI